MTTITILSRDYQLPAVPAALKDLCASINKQLAIIESGAEPREPRLGIIPRRARPLTIAERLAQVDALAVDYRRLLTDLHAHLDACRSGFTAIAKGVKSALAVKAEKLRTLEHKRLTIIKTIPPDEAESVRTRMEELHERLLHIVRIVGEATLLILRQIDQGWETITDFTEHLNRQRQVLEGLELEQQVGKLEQTVPDTAEQELRFQEFLRSYSLALKTVLAQTESLAPRLTASAAEIGRLTIFLESEKGNLPMLDADALILDLLSRAPLGREQLMVALQPALLLEGRTAELEQRIAMAGEATLDDALNNITAYFQLRIESSFGKELLAGARTADGPDAWFAYLDEFSNGIAAPEARAALAQLAESALARARAQETSDDWHYYLSNFVMKPAAAEPHAYEAREGLLRCQARERRNVKTWREYLHHYPAGTAVAEARAFLQGLEWVPDWACAYGRDDLPNGARWADLTVNNVTQRFRLIEPGTFLMGSASDEPGHEEREQLHEVTLTRPFWMADSECTQAFWQAVMENNPSHFKDHDRPVEMVSWSDCQQFLRALNQLVPGLEATLPTEAQWEYACRANTTGPFANATQPHEAGWFSDNSGGQTRPVKQLKPNGWGLYDMHGNVQEWCLDDLRTYGAEKVVDPVGPVSGAAAVCRGGCWDWGWNAMRAATRPRHGIGERWQARGLRIAAPSQLKIESDVDRLSRMFAGSIFLGELKAFGYQTADGKVHINEAMADYSVTVGAKRCAQFVSLYAPASCEWVIPKGARGFTAVGCCADNPDVIRHGAFVIQILVNDKIVFVSPPSNERRGGIPIDIALAPDDRRLAVRIDHLGDGNGDVAVLAWPQFHGHFDDWTKSGVRPPISADVAALAQKPAHGLFLGDLQPLHVNVWRFMVNKDWNSSAIAYAGDKPCDKFLFTLAPAQLVYAIPASARRFTAVGTHTLSDRAPQGSWRYQALIDGEMVFESAPFYQYPAGLPIDVAIPAGSKQLTLLVDQLDNNNHGDEAVWAWPYFHIDADAYLEQLSERPSTGIYLGDLEPLSVQVGHATYAVDKVVSDTGDSEPHLAIVGSKPCSKYLWLHAPARAVYAVPAGATRFSAIGARIDRPYTLHGSWKYQIYLDNRLVFDSPPLRDSLNGIPIDISLPAQARELAIVVDDFGDNACDHSVVAFPYFHLPDPNLHRDTEDKHGETSG